MSPLSSIAGAAVRIATPLVLAATGEVIAERAGIINVGIEGIMLAAAGAAFLVSLTTGSALAGLAVAVLIGMLLAALLAGLVLGLNVDQVVCGLGINLLAAGAAGTAYRMVVGETGTKASLGPLPLFIDQEPFVWVALALVVLVWWLVARSTWGVALRATGDAPLAAEAAGLSVKRVRFLAVLAGGFFAALAGADLELAHARTFTEDLTGGRGFMALAIVLFGRWSPWRVALAALFFGGAEALEAAIQASGSEWVRHTKALVIALPYVLSLAVLALPRKKGRDETPGALGQPYE